MPLVGFEDLDLYSGRRKVLACSASPSHDGQPISGLVSGAAAKCNNRSDSYRLRPTGTGLLICVNDLRRPTCFSVNGNEKLYPFVSSEVPEPHLRRLTLKRLGWRSLGSWSMRTRR
jgi:hypothetical protein